MEKPASNNQYPYIGIYEHYKSTPEDRRLYQIIDFARHTESDETMVVYIPLYTIPERRGLRLLVRPLDMFMENVEHNGQSVPRFRFVGTEL